MFLTDKIAFITNPDTDKTTYRWKKKMIQVKLWFVFRSLYIKLVENLK